MKIGILTYHRTHNYGGCLQAVATRIVLEQMGHRVFYIDYWPEYHRRVYEGFSWRKLMKTPGIKSKLYLIYENIKFRKSITQRRINFESFINNKIAPFCKSCDEEFDVVIYGSDQIWRKQPDLNRYNPVYFADNTVKAHRKIAFSASMGVLPKADSDKVELSVLLSNFDAIAVREAELQNLCQTLINKPISLTLDPTLLVPDKIWNYFAITNTSYNGPKYILVYALHDTFNIESIRHFAEKKNLRVKIIYGYANHKEKEDEITTAGPMEFVNLVRNSEFVFTSSFHGLVFSIIYKRNFITSFGDNAGRAKSLLAELGLVNRFIQPKEAIPENLSLIDYSIVDEKLNVMRENSMSFLYNELKSY